MTQEINPYYDQWGNHFGYCNACGEEQILGLECSDVECTEGEVVAFADDPDGDEA